jgi:hypothetical protein
MFQRGGIVGQIMVRLAQTCWLIAAATAVVGCSDPGASPIDAAPIDGVTDAAIDAEVDGPGVDATALVTGLTAPRAIVLTGGYVYVVTGGNTGMANGTVARVPIAGGELQILASGQSQPYDLQVSDRVYWTNGTFFAINGRSLRAMPLNGGPDVAIAAFNPGPFVLAIDATTAYVTRAETGQPLTSVPLAGGATNDLIPPTGVIHGLEVDATHVYYIVAGQVRRVHKSGAVASELLADGPEARALAGHGDTLYWISGNVVMRVGRDGSGVATVATSTRQLTGIAVDDTHVYVGEVGDGDGRIVRAPIGGGSFEPISTARHDLPFAIAVDDAAIYWTEGDIDGQGKVYKVAK